MKYKPLLLATMSSEEQYVSISEAPMSSDDGKSELEQYWCEFVERALPGTTLVRVDVLFDGRGRVTVRYVPPWDKKLIGSFMDAANALVDYCICRVEVDTSKLRFEYIHCDDTTIRPSLMWDNSNLEPAVDPGAFCKPRTPDKPRGVIPDGSQLELPPQPDLGAFMTYKEQPDVPDAVREIAKQNTFRSEPPKIHPIQQARMAKDAAEPNSFLRQAAGRAAPGVNMHFQPPAPLLPPAVTTRGRGFRTGEHSRSVVLWQREWDDEVRRVVKSPNPVRDQQVAETRNAFVKDLVMAEFSRLAMENAKHDADAISHAVAQVDQARELLKKEVRRDYMLRLFLTFVVGVAVVLVLHVVAW